MSRLMPFLLVGLGSFVGGNARYLTARWVGSSVEARFPVATFAINVIGSFVLGVLGGALALRPVPHAEALRLALGVGFCGGFTTFSAFAFEASALLDERLWATAALYAGLSLAAGLLAVRLGLLAARMVF